MEKEEGEMSDDNSMIVDQQSESIDTSFTVIYKPEKTGVLIEKLGKTDAIKLEERAKRFGLDLTGHRAITQTQLDELYENFHIKSGNERHFRFDTIHLSGIDGLNTKEIFEYLEDYKPLSLEWIDRNSCNVVCQDHITAALALLAHSREIQNEELKKMLDSTKSHWREGFPHPKKDLILFRFATKSDKRNVNSKNDNGDNAAILNNTQDDNINMENSATKNPWGDLCQSWGIYDHQEIFHRPLAEDSFDNDNKVVQVRNKKLAKRLGKRHHKTDDLEDSNSDSEWKRKHKVPRMRMHADDEELREQKKKLQVQVGSTKDSKAENDFTPLSIEIVNIDSKSSIQRSTTKLSDKFKSNVRNTANQHKDNIQSRLGTKLTTTNGALSSDDSSSSYTDANLSSRVHKVTKSVDKRISNVWSRLDKKLNEKETSCNDLRQKLKKQKHKNVDLRKKIGSVRKGRSPLRIEVDNEYYGNSD